MLMAVISLYKMLWCVRGLYPKNIEYVQDFLSNQEEVIGGWKKLHEELCDVCFSPDIVRVIK